MLHEERQGNKCEHLCRKAADTTPYRKRKYRNPEQVNRKDRHRKLQLSADINHPHNNRYHGLKYQQRRKTVVRNLLDGIDKQAKKHGIQHHALSIKFTDRLGRRIMRQQFPADKKGSQS